MATVLGRLRRRVIDPDKLLLKQYHLSRAERVDMLLRGLVYSQLAIPIGSALYFILSQTNLSWGYPKQGTTFFNLYLGDTWDRLPIHIDNLLHHPFFAPLGTVAAPHLWVVARHDARHVMIGFAAALLIGAVTIGLKKRKRASTLRMVLSVPAAFIVAMVVAGALVVFFSQVAPAIDHWGVSTSNPYVEGIIGKGTIQLTIIGFAAGYAAKIVLHRTFDTIQLMSLERNIAQGQAERWWWKIVYPPNYRQRFRYLKASGSTGHMHSRWLGLTLSIGAPVVLFLLGFGIWLLYFGPAVAAH